MTVALSDMMTGAEQQATARPAHTIPALTHSEAAVLAQTEYARLLAVLEALDGDDWQQPTYCAAWTVRDMVAHLAGACAGWSSWAEFRRQVIQNPYLNETGQQVDGINKRQILDRAERTPAELVAEFRDLAPKATRTRQRLPALLRNLRLPLGPPLGTAPLHYLTDNIYTRDQWMHRYDLCAATGKAMVATPAHDGRIVALVVRDLAQALDKKLARPVQLVLTGVAGGVFHLGASGEPACTVTLDVYDFNLLASGRIAAAEAQSRATVSGDQADATAFLTQVAVPY